MPLAILCSGQGGQHSGMFALTNAAPAAEPLFAHAAVLLGGVDPRELVESASADALHENRNAQILCVLQALAAMSALREVMPEQLIVAGYSVGEIAAWGIAQSIALPTTLDLVARRAELMNAASTTNDGLTFVRGLERAEIDDLCKRHAVEIAIVEPDEAFIVGGQRSSLDALGNEARRRSARVIDLPVKVAAHTSRLHTASVAFRQVIADTPVQMPQPTTRLLSGVDGSAVIGLSTALDKLAAQISHTVQWEACLASCAEAGATAFFEPGPGHALANMAARAYPNLPARSLDDFRSLSGARAWLAEHAHS